MRSRPFILALLVSTTAGLAADHPTAPPRRPAETSKAAAILAQRTISASRQFSIFCPDSVLRSRVASFTEEVKTHLLQVLGQGDGWKHPILISVEKATPGPTSQPPVALSLYQNDAGFKIQIDVRFGDDPAQVNLHKYVVRALLLEMEYRDRPELLSAGTAFVEAPWWLVEGVSQLFLRRETGFDTDLFKRIVDVNRPPPIGKFLAGAPSDFAGTAVETMDQACAMCLVQLLIEQPSGRDGLVALLHHWPEASGNDPVASLTKEFSRLGQNEQSLQKWWTLNLARFAVADRFKGLNSAETETALAPLLQYEIELADGTKQTFTLADYTKFFKLPKANPVLATAYSSLMSLGTRAHLLYRPLLTEYAGILGQLAKKKTRGLKSRIAKADELRGQLQQHTTRIADYLNWFEATQMDVRSGKFEGYLKAAAEFTNPPPRPDPLSRYLDSVALDQAAKTP